MFDTRQALNLKVAVSGTNYEVFLDNTSIATGSDASLAAGKIGVQSWAQAYYSSTKTPPWGTEVESVSVTQGANTLYQHTFNSRPMAWRQLYMRNPTGDLATAGPPFPGPGSGLTADDLGNFGNVVGKPWIFQHHNGYVNATSGAGNADFIGPAVVVDEPGSAALTNYEFRTRIGAGDNDGLGVLFRVQDNDNYYRVTFTNEATGAGDTRSPQGMSIQKFRNGVWSELYRETTPTFLYSVNTVGATPDDAGYQAFDLSVRVVGDKIKVAAKDHNNVVYTYPIIQDSSDPILSGSVGLHTWGTTEVYYMGYGGQNGPLVQAASSLNDVSLVVDRSTGNISIVNNDLGGVAIKGVSITSNGGAMKPASWTSIADAYDEPPGNGSVDPDDPWTETSATVFDLSEAELSGGNGGTLAGSGTINLGNAWTKSRIEDVSAVLTLADGTFEFMTVQFINGPNGGSYQRSDLNADGSVTLNDWLLFYPNMLTNMSSLSIVEQVLAGDLDLDGDNDVEDFALFKADYDAVNGAGAFVAMLSAVPEPTTLLLVVMGILGISFGRFRGTQKRLPIVGAASVLALAICTERAAIAVPVDLSTFTMEAYPIAGNFPAASWTLTPSTATAFSNGDGSVAYSTDSPLNKRYIGRLNAGADDDVVGFVLGFDPGDAQIGSSADYLLIDWKGVTQSYDFTDQGAINYHHDKTPSGSMPIGLAISRVTGSPTGDEMWQHADLPENDTGGVVQLARGTTLGSTSYNRSGGYHIFDISYTATNVKVSIDGVEQINLNGSFPDGRFGLYAAYQGPGEPSFSNIEVVPATGFAGLSVTVDQGTGEIRLLNTGTEAVALDYYQIDSAAGSLNVGNWSSLSDQGFQSTGGGGPGESWDEAGGSSNNAMAEVYLTSTPAFAGNTSVGLGNIFNNVMNAHDLVVNYRLSSGLVVPAPITYIGTPPGVPGDYNDNGVVDSADYVLWRKGGPLQNEVATFGSTTPEDYTEWRARFGNTSGSGSSLAGGQGVPEPALWSLMFSTIAASLVCRRSRFGR
ncbi:MAG: PEP-CTERM sorting domain-containing protein [Pirellulales bacterium]|nr:PEP-CTERM sorting domain-containing protein [Pirellulales bacterium]